MIDKRKTKEELQGQEEDRSRLGKAATEEGQEGDGKGSWGTNEKGGGNEGEQTFEGEEGNNKIGGRASQMAEGAGERSLFTKSVVKEMLKIGGEIDVGLQTKEDAVGKNEEVMCISGKKLARQ